MDVPRLSIGSVVSALVVSSMIGIERTIPASRSEDMSDVRCTIL